MKDEFSNIVNAPVSTNTQAKEYSESSEFSSSNEYHDTDEFNEKATNSATKKKSSGLLDTINKLIRAMSYTAATGTVAVIATIFILNVDLFNERPDVEFHYVEAGENEMSYYINIGEAEDLKIRLYNDTEVYEVEADSGINSGEFLDLSPNTTYKLAVCGESRYGSDIISEIEVKTKMPHEVIITDINDFKVSYECKCIIDGCFHFKVDFIDTEGVYTDFKAYLIDSDGVTIEYYFMSNYSSEQKIDVSQAQFSGDKENIRFIVTCSYNGETYTIVDTIVSI